MWDIVCVCVCARVWEGGAQPEVREEGRSEWGTEGGLVGKKETLSVCSQSHASCLLCVCVLCVCVSTVMSGEQAHAEAPAGTRQRRRSEIEGYSATLASLKLSPMYPEEEQRTAGGMSSTVHYLDGTFDYSTSTTTTNPDASNSSVDYYSTAPDLQVAPEPQDENLQPLANGSTSPLVFVPSSPQLSPFLGHPPTGQHTAQQVPYYLEPSGTSIYRSEGLRGI